MAMVDQVFGSLHPESTWPYTQGNDHYTIAVSRMPTNLNEITRSFWSRISNVDAEYYYTVIHIHNNHFIGLFFHRPTKRLHMIDSMKEKLKDEAKRLMESSLGQVLHVRPHTFDHQMGEGCGNACGILCSWIAGVLFSGGFVDKKMTYPLPRIIRRHREEISRNVVDNLKRGCSVLDIWEKKHLKGGLLLPPYLPPEAIGKKPVYVDKNIKSK